MSHEQRLAEILTRDALALPPAAEPKGLYRPLLIVGNLAYTAGHLPIGPDGALVKGRAGETLDTAAAQAAARLVGLGILASLRKGLGSLDRVRRLVKVLGMVNCTDDFIEQPAVLNGLSQLMADVFGPDCGVGVRSAVGVNTLPLGAVVEAEAVFEID